VKTLRSYLEEDLNLLENKLSYFVLESYKAAEEDRSWDATYYATIVVSTVKQANALRAQMDARTNTTMTIARNP
jgi:hypothetical protein